MGKIKKLLSKKSIKTSFVLYVALYIFLSFFSSLYLSSLCQSVQRRLRENHSKAYQSLFQEANPNADLEADFFNEHYFEAYGTEITSPFSTVDLWIYNSLNLLSFAVYPLCFIVGILITSTLFYRRQLKTPLAILEDAADKIANETLDFSISCQTKNELGKLCTSFEKMRIALRDNNLELWRQMEERKRLNAAFAHDLRTPLTVLKGQSEMLANYASEMSVDAIASAAEMMGRHIARLETYVNTMHDLHSLEEIEVKKQPVDANDMIKQLKDIAFSVCGEKELTFLIKTIQNPRPMLDAALVLRVYENLLANAIRYASEHITVTAEIQNTAFCLTVSDDGAGFSAETLANAAKPFYKAKNETNSGHLGMGLYICSVLCKKHGGSLILSNQNGANVTSVYRWEA